MTENVYECDSCMYKTPRRTNANRHIRLVHNGTAIAFNNKTRRLSTQKSTTNHKNKSEIDLESQIIYDIINDVMGSFERLESLVRFFPEQMRVKFLSDTLITSLLYTEPHKVINEKIKTIQNELPMVKLSNYISASNKMELAVAIVFLKGLVENSPAYELRKLQKEKK
ncbi:hypothetical protein BH23THE1_BH23THE1_20920 [soil metagenome]